MNNKKTFTFFIPGLNKTRLNTSLWGQFGDELSAFNSLFSKAKIIDGLALDSCIRYFELVELFDLHYTRAIDLPFANIFYSNFLSEQPKTDKTAQNFWVYNVSPVVLYPDMDQLILADNLTEQINDEQAKEICQVINSFFTETEQDKTWQLVYYAKNQWFIISEQQLINQPMPADRMGKALTRSTVKNDMASYWIQTLNEIQMLLFSLGQKQQQKSTQALSVCNSLWIWGESYFSCFEQQPHLNRWDTIYSDNFLLQQLAQYTHTPCKANNKFNLIEQQTAANSLIVLNELEEAIRSEDALAIVDVLKAYEERYFVPIKQALLADKNLSVNIISNAKQLYSINRSSLKSWWKRTKNTGKILELL
ncbi:MAG: hypothetical protein QM479_08680 [Pseudomonadota bacterium]